MDINYYIHINNRLKPSRWWLQTVSDNIKHRNSRQIFAYSLYWAIYQFLWQQQQKKKKMENVKQRKAQRSVESL